VVIGGLISSTALTLVLVPVLYRLVEGRRERKALAKAADGDGATAAPAPSRGRRAAPGAILDDFPDDLPEDARLPTGSR
jgi:HAE1 family hydrophobic/amphiphilic exporter-1